jgi:hypothetical protein
VGYFSLPSTESYQECWVVVAKCQLPNGATSDLGFFAHSEETAKRLVSVIEAEMTVEKGN